MECKKNKLKYNCGVKTSARCVFYDLELPDISKLKILDDCMTIEETTDDLYSLVDLVYESLNTEELGEKCLTYKKVKNKYKPGENITLIKDVLLKFEEEICKLKTSNEDEDDTLSLDFKCLVSPCGEQITNLKDLLQTLIDEICILKGQ